MLNTTENGLPPLSLRWTPEIFFSLPKLGPYLCRARREERIHQVASQDESNSFCGNVLDVSFYLDIDVSKLKLDGALPCPGGKCRNKTIGSIHEWSGGFRGTCRLAQKKCHWTLHVYKEAMNVYRKDVASYSSDGDHMVSVIHAALFKAQGRSLIARNKIDLF